MPSRCSPWLPDRFDGILHEPSPPSTPPTAAVALTHGAGGDRDSPLLIALCDAFAAIGWAALRLNLAYRRKRPKGPPSPSGAAADRAELLETAESLRPAASRVYLGGSSYGGRQCSMLLADNPKAADALLLLSYPLHPPGKPEKLRTGHFPQLASPCLFAHGSRDAFGSIEEMQSALPLIPAPTDLLVIDGATHGIVQKRDSGAKAAKVADRIARHFLQFVSVR